MRPLAILLSVAIVFGSASADTRRWTDRTGSFSTEAKLVESDGQEVTLLKTDGSQIKVPVGALSVDDQRFVREFLKNRKPRAQTAFQRIEAALTQKSPERFVEIPLSDALAALGAVHEVEIVVDNVALSDHGIESDTVMVSISGRELTLEQVLEKLLSDLDLKWIIRHEVLLITTDREYESELMATRVYRILNPISADELIEDVVANIDPYSWFALGGVGEIASIATDMLIIMQTDEVHRQIDIHYEKLLESVEPVQPSMLDLPRIDVPTKGLLAELSGEFFEMPLRDVVSLLSEEAGIDIRIDAQALDELGLGEEAPVTLDVDKASLASVLSLALRRIASELTWSVDETGVLVTTKYSDEDRLELIGYEVDTSLLSADLADLATVIPKILRPDVWDENRGSGSVRAGIRGTLDVRQTFQMHQHVARLLQDLKYSAARRE